MKDVRNLFFIIEGPDNVGKTTLIQNIKNRFNDYTFHALHYSNVKQRSTPVIIQYNLKLYIEMFDLMSTINDSKIASGVICDRSHLGEMVYGPIYREYSGEYVLDIEEEYSKNDFWNSVFLITLYDEPENLIKRDDGLSFTTELEKKTKEINNFKFAHDQSYIKNKLLLNIKDHNAEQAIDAVVKFVEES